MNPSFEIDFKLNSDNISIAYKIHYKYIGKDIKIVDSSYQIHILNWEKNF